MRKLTLIMIALAVGLLSSTLLARTENARISKTINSEWVFNYFPDNKADTQDWHTERANDSSWPIVALPHTWSTYETTGEEHVFMRNPAEQDSGYWWHGWGWYRKHFALNKSLKGKKVFVEFDGVQKYSRLWLNGVEVGDHKGGFNSFYFDITKHVRFGADNVLAVAVNNSRKDKYKIPPMTAGNWNVYGGIYRDVRIVVKDPLHIPFQGSAKHEGGTFVTTPKVSAEKATVRVRTWVRNDYTKAVDCTLETSILDPNGKTLQALRSKRTIQPGAVFEFDQNSDEIRNPKLWSPETPNNLYKVISTVKNGSKIADTYESPLGFRWFKWNKEKKRLVLNGKGIHIHGTNYHQEYPWLGDAMPKWMHERDLRDIRFGLAHNFIRGAHYSHDKNTYNLCDKFGILVCEEVPNIKRIDFSEEVQEQNVREMVRRDRNHPSILFWSMGNETSDGADSKWAWEEDPTRIIHARHISGDSAGEYVTHTDEDMDMENLLRCTVRGWYNTDVRDLRPKANQHTGTEEWQHINARIAGASQRGRIDMGNGVMWIYADHGADREYKHCPLKHINPKGWVDAYRIPKYLYYLWQANYSPKPMVFIHPHYWRKQYVGSKRDFMVDSNCDTVELFVDKKSFGTLQPNKETFNTVTFAKIPVTSGTLRAVGRKEGQTVEGSVVMAGKPAKLTISSSHDEIGASLENVAIVKADIVDAKGTHVYGATNTLVWSVSGPATLVGMPVYETDIGRNGAMDGPMYIDTPVCNVIRASGEPGVITVRVEADGIKAAELRIKAAVNKQKASGYIIEPKLLRLNRGVVARNSKYRTDKVSSLSKAMARTQVDIIHKLNSLEEYRQYMGKLLRSRNPGISKDTEPFKVVVNLFAKHLADNNGELVADDYNFTVEHFNTCSSIIKHINKMSVTPEEKTKLRKDYIKRILVGGEIVDAEAEMRRFR